MGRPRLEDDIYLSQLRIVDEAPPQARAWKGPQSLGGRIAKGILDELLTKPEGTFVTVPRPAAHVVNTIRAALCKGVKQYKPGWTASVWHAENDRLTCVVVKDIAYQRTGAFKPRGVQ